MTGTYRSRRGAAFAAEPNETYANTRPADARAATGQAILMHRFEYFGDQ
jgi:hypothetical protein